ncbi:MAG: porin [Myxococcota bacterium]
MSFQMPHAVAALLVSLSFLATPVVAAEGNQDLLDVLRANGSITNEQYESLSAQEALTTQDVVEAAEPAKLPPVAAEADANPALNQQFSDMIAEAVALKVEEEFPVKASYGKKGFRLESRDGNWQTNLQWRAQMRLTWPRRSDPRSVSNFAATERVTFENRRLRMKIGGHGYQPWLKYYFEVDLQPTRDSDDSSSNASARVIDWRIDVAKYKKFGIRVGQWKIDYNRERVDSSGRQQFVERSIVNRTFTIDRQVGISFRGHLFEGTPGDLRYAFGIFTGEGRGVNNDDNNLMYTGRVQWNFLGRDLALRQTDVERTEKPTASLAFGGATHSGVCTRWSSGGCGNLDGFTSAGSARQGQFRVHQAVQEFAFKHQGFSFQQEFHWKRVIDRAQTNGSALHRNDLYGGYAQAGYFFSEIYDAFPEELELAFRYAYVREPNGPRSAGDGGFPSDRNEENVRQEFTAGANWFFSGHNNKITFDYSHLTLKDDVVSRSVSDDRVRLQWDISF